MMILKIAPVLLLVLVVGAEKKIELQDIEEDNLKSERESNYETGDTSNDSDDVGHFDYLKKGLLRYFKTSSPTEASERYVHQYAVTEPQERFAVTPAPQYGPPGAQQAMVGYLSNIPMQIYLVPQYNGVPAEVKNTHAEGHYSGQSVNPIANYETNEAEQAAYVAPSVKQHVHPHPSPVTYISYSPKPTVHPEVAPAAPALSHQVPIVHFQSALVPPPAPAPHSQHLYTKVYYTNDQYSQGQFEDDRENVVESQHYYGDQTETPYAESQSQDAHKYYNPRTPLRVNSNSELPHPSPLLLKAPPSHLSHIPKALPIHRPWSKPVYNNGRLGIGSIPSKSIETYGPMFKRRPTSLLDSYVPSRLQIEYLKRGIIKDPLVAFEALSNGLHLDHPLPSPSHYETGFLPNQVFHTAGGGSFYGHYKRSPTVDERSKS